MEGEDDGDTDDGEVYAQTQPGEKGTLVGEVVARRGGGVGGKDGS